MALGLYLQTPTRARNSSPRSARGRTAPEAPPLHHRRPRMTPALLVETRTRQTQQRVPDFAPLHIQIVQKLRCRFNATHQQLFPGASAGDIEQMPFGIINFSQFTLVRG